MLHSTASSKVQGIRFPRLYDLAIAILTRGRSAEYRDAILKIANIKETDSVLDVGCGTGDQALAICRQTGFRGRVVGVDVSPQMVERARKKLNGSYSNVDVKLSCANHLPCANEEFEVALLVTVLHMLPVSDQPACLAEVSRVLKPGGRVILIDYAGDVDARKHISSKHGRHGAFDLAKFSEYLPQCQLDKVEENRLGWLDLSFVVAKKCE
jgi:ubiquinone/menaquinone biosynthesis C-methylase UbiE